MAFLCLRSRANQKPHKAHSASTRRALSAKRERHGRGACEFPLSPVGFRTPTAANPDTKTQEGLCCDVLLCLQGARPRGARAPRRPLATGCAGGGRPNVRKRGARCTRTPKKRILLRRIAPWPLGPPIEIPRAFAHLRPPGNEPNGPAIAPRGPRPRGCCPLPRRSPSLRAWSAPSLHA